LTPINEALPWRALSFLARTVEVGAAGADLAWLQALRTTTREVNAMPSATATATATAKKISEYILAAFQEVSDPITSAKLHKLLYYVQGWHLAHFGEPAFEDRIEAWMHGPSCPAIEALYDGFWHLPITTAIPQPQDLAERLRELVDQVIELYGEDTGYSLHMRTRLEPPWNEARWGLSRHDDSCTAEISWESMKRFFLSEEARSEAA
jgi:uncharacterized phage-associated protein